MGLVGGFGFGGGCGGWLGGAGVGRMVRRELCRGCSGLRVGRTGAVWMTVSCVCGAVVGGVAGFLGVGAGSGWWVSAEERVIDALVCGSCRSVDPLKHAVEVLGRVIGGEWGVVGVNYLRFGYMVGGSAAGTTILYS